MAKFRSPDFKSPDCRGSFLQFLFKTRTDKSGREKYGCSLIFANTMRTAKLCKLEDGRMASLEDIVRDTIVGEWGDKGLVKAKAGLIKSPFLAGDGKEARNKTTGELHPGMGPDVFFIRVNANADRQPKVWSSPSGLIPATPKEVYSGCYGFAVLNAFPWTNDEGGDGVSFGIQHFFKRADGERLGDAGDGGTPDRWAEAVEDTGEAPASTKSGAGAGGLFGD